MKTKREILEDFVNEIAPTHCRTSCNDDNSNGNEFFNEYGYPHCVRCAFLFRVEYGFWPLGASARVDSIKLTKEK